MISAPGSRLGRCAELFALCGFAITQPLLWLTGQNPVFLVVHDIFGIELLAFALLAVIVPVAAASLADRLAYAMTPGSSRVFGASIRGLLLAAITAPILIDSLNADRRSSAVIYLVTMAIATLAWLRFRSLRSIVRYLWFAPAVFVVWFLAGSPASALVFPGEAGTTDTIGRSDTSVVWVIFDQLPTALLIDAEGGVVADRFPNFARLAERSTWYVHASTVASSTVLAVPAALGGRIPPPDSLPVASQLPQNLFTLLARTHRVHAWESYTQLCPDSVCLDDAAGPGSTPPVVFDSFVVVGHLLLGDSLSSVLLPPIDHGWGGFGVGSPSVDIAVEGEAETLDEVASRRVRGYDRGRVDELLDSISHAQEPTLHYLHIEKPHEPLLFLPDGRTYTQCSCFAVDEDGRWPTGSMAGQRFQQYLLQTMYVDTVLGEVIDTIDRSPQADKTMLVVMSDHGVSLLPGSANRELDRSNADDILPVPVFIMDPGQRSPRVDARAISITSILPTVLAKLGVSVPDARFDGVSLADPAVVPPHLEVLASGSRVVLDRLPDARRSPLIAWRDALSPDPSNPYAWGEGSALHGADVSTLDAGASLLTVKLESPTELSAAPPDTSVPAHVFGEIAGTDQESDLVVTVNDVVAGSGRSFYKDFWRISLIVDPEYVDEDKAGRIRVFELVSGRLQELTLSS